MKKLFTFPKETVKLKVKSANPAIEDDTEEVELSKRDFEQLKKKMIINIAWSDNPVWAYSISDTLHILEIYSLKYLWHLKDVLWLDIFMSTTGIL